MKIYVVNFPMDTVAYLPTKKEAEKFLKDYRRLNQLQFGNDKKDDHAVIEKQQFTLQQLCDLLNTHPQACSPEQLELELKRWSK